MRTAEIDNPQDLAALVRECAAGRLPLVDYGVAHAGLGHPAPAEHVKLTQRGAVLEHHTADFTVRAAAGAAMGDLRAALESAGQFVPLDADDDMTLGEVINHNVYGPLRVGYGAVRDLLLGVNYIDGAGQDIHVGGRTIKNVAGLDVARFLVGSLGELAVIYEATLRTYAIPEQVLAVDLRVDDPRCIDDMLTTWLAADAAPSRLALALEDGRWVVRLAYFGRSSACLAQLRSLETLIQRTAGFRVIGSGRQPYDQYARERGVHRRWRRRMSALVKVVVPPGSTGATCKDLLDLDDIRARFTLGAMPAHGCIFAGADLGADDTRRLDREISEIIEPLGGLRVWYARPLGAEDVAPFAPPQPDWPMLAQLKRTMDPHGILNPGRFLPVDEGGQHAPPVEQR
jgi:glycolate oxidase FAD binding subunit